MSTDNDSHHEASTKATPTTGQESGFLRRRSVKPDDALTRESSAAPSEQSSHQGATINLVDLISQGLRFTDHPDEARQMLYHLANVKPGTDVSHSLKNLSAHYDDNLAPRTLLYLLARWLPVWFGKADKERRENKSSRTSMVKEQQNLDWLLRYLLDYLNLGHTDMDTEELASTIEAVTVMCLSATKEGDINNGINILYAVALNYQFPKRSLDQSLVVLCASAANLPAPPEHLVDVARLLVSGSLREDCVQTLFSFILTPTLGNEIKNLSHARGAARIIQKLIDQQNIDGVYVFSLPPLIATLKTAAGQNIFRLAFDLLNTVQSILSCQPRQAEVVGLDFSEIMDIINLCLDVSPANIRAAKTPNGPLSPPSNSQDDPDRAYERHFRDRDAAAKNLARALSALREHLPSVANGFIIDFFLMHPQYVEVPQLVETLEQVGQKFLAGEDHEVRRKYADCVYQNIIRNNLLPQACRLKGIDVVVHSKETTEHSSSASSQTCGAEYAWILDKLLTQIDTERDETVFQTLLKSLHYMAKNYEEAAKEPSLTQQTIKKLGDLILLGPKVGSWNDDLAVLGTQVLTTILAYSIHTSPAMAIYAFEVLLDVASPKCKSRLARLVSKRLLFRIRADDAGYIYINSGSESEDIAPALLRTRTTLDIFQNEQPISQRHSASSTSLSSKSDGYETLWIYPETEDTDYPFSGRPSSVLNVNTTSSPDKVMELDMDTWLMNIIKCLQTDTDWETYSFTIVHTAAQLSNIALFLNSLEAIIKLRQVLCEQIVNGSFREAPASTGLKKSDVAICMFNFLTSLVPYATIKSEAIQKGFGDDLVRAFISGLGGTWEGTSRKCIHALSVCSLEVPSSVAGLYPTIIDKMSKNMTQAHLTSHILDFLTQVALQTEMHSNLNSDEVKVIFGICIQLLEKVREQHSTSVLSPQGRMTGSTRHSGMNFRRPPYRAAMLTELGLPQYAAALAYHNMIFWFLALPLENRGKYVSWIVPRLVWKNAQGEETIDEQSQVLIDMMQRTAYSDLGETSPVTGFAEAEDGPVSSASWIVGLSIITAEVAGHTGKTQIIKRQASGTTYARYQQLTAQLPPHHAPTQTQIHGQDVTTEILPPHIILQMMESAAATSLADQPVRLPRDDFVSRSLDIFDRIPTVASHKIGVLYIGEGQLKESEFLANTHGSPDYERLLAGLGYVVSLKPPLQFKPQGLEYGRDGSETIAWRDRVAEIVYLVPTMMPTDSEDDPQCIMKKAHVGNCHVNVIFNRSDAPWDFDKFKSQLNYVNIVIRPACRGSGKVDKDFMPGFYWVHVVTRDDLPSLSPAAEPKMISAAQLPQFVRVLAINASQFCLTWNNRDIDNEFPSEWRSRLQHIKRLKQQVSDKMGDRRETAGLLTGATGPPGVSSTNGGRKTPVAREEASRRDGLLASQLDFSSWTHW